MAQVRIVNTFTSVAVVVALVTLTALAVCCVAISVPTAASAFAATGACGMDAHHPVGTVAALATVPTVTKSLSAAPPAAVLLVASRGPSTAVDRSLVELPPPGDPRHGRIRV